MPPLHGALNSNKLLCDDGERIQEKDALTCFSLLWWHLPWKNVGNHR